MNENICINSKKVNLGDIFIAIKGGRTDGHLFIDEAISNGASKIILSDKKIASQIKNIPVLLVNDTTLALQDISRSRRKENKNLCCIGITGSAGKTTTKDMVFSILSKYKNTIKSDKSFNNHIGVPLTLIKVCQDTHCAVVEIGTNFFGEIKDLCNIAKPTYGVITNIGNAHIETLGSKDGVLKEKMDLLKSIPESGICFFNADDEYLMKIKDKIKSKVITFGIKNKADYMASDIELDVLSCKYILNKKYKIKLNITGSHNVYNSLAAIAISDSILKDVNKCIKGLKDYKETKSRFNIKKINGITVIDDTYNANPQSFKSALQTIKEIKFSFKRVIMFIGDMLELGKESQDLHENLGMDIALVNPDKLFITGDYSKDVFIGAVKNGIAKGSIVYKTSPDELLEKVAFSPQKGDLVFVKGSRGMRMERFLAKMS